MNNDACITELMFTFVIHPRNSITKSLKLEFLVTFSSDQSLDKL